MVKSYREWTVNSKLGEIAMLSWGDSTKPPVLLVHGYMDSAATFILLVEHLPDNFYYVGFDLPGHGKSQPLPPGLLVSQMNMVETVRFVVEYMQWETFIYMSHSMGFLIGVYYNHIFPGKVTKMIHIDPAPPIATYYYFTNSPDSSFQYFYDTFYRSYDRWNAGSMKRITFEEAVNLLVRNRSLTEDQAETVLSRSLVSVGEGKYKLSWDTRMKKIITDPISEETLYTIITQHAPPMLIIEASENRNVPPGKELAANLLEKCQLMIPNFFSATVTGGHDLHITSPELVGPYIEEFLLTNKIKTVKSKL